MGNIIRAFCKRIIVLALAILVTGAAQGEPARAPIPDVKISGLPSAGPLTGDELVPMSQNDIDVSVELAQLTVVPEPVDRLQYRFVGHSLTDPVPSPFMRLVGGSMSNVRIQTIPGATLNYNWNNAGRMPNDGYVENVRAAIEAGNIDILVLTERADFPTEHEGTMEYLETWYDHFKDYNPTGRAFLYEVWQGIPDFDTTPDWAAWIAQIEADRLRYETAAETLKATVTGDDNMYIIPGGQALKALYEAVDNHEISDLSDFSDIFADDIHLSDIGAYFMSLVHYAAIHKTSPVGLPWRVSANPWNQNETVAGLTADMAADMQALAWSVVSTYPYAGIAE